MIALGVLKNTPPNSYQPVLTRGIHLRWGFLPELGFPWHGFYLYRRPARAGVPLCLGSVIGGLKKGNWPEKKHYTALGVLSSNTNLVLTEYFTPANQVEFDLDGRNYLRFDLREGELARRVELHVGFRQDRCLDLGTLIPGDARPPDERARAMAPVLNIVGPNPLVSPSVSFAVKTSDGTLGSQTHFGWIDTPAGPLMGLKCGYGLTIKLSAASDTVDLSLTLTQAVAAARAVVAAASGTTVEAFDSKNKKVATASVVGPANQPQTITLAGKNIIRIEVLTLRDTASLHRICADKLKLERKAEVTVTAFSGTTPIRSMIITGQPGKIVSASIEADAISAVEIGPGPGSLVDLCYVPVAQNATLGWTRLPTTLSDALPTLTYPIGLPVTHADYPCSVPDPPRLLLDRVRYPLPPGWKAPDFDPPNFKMLREQLVALVKGGPNSAPMADRIFDAPPEESIPPDPNPPKLSKFYLLDMLLLGALHPGLAQLLGLYWVDLTANEKESYDYLIVADHRGVGQRDPDKVLAVIQSSGFAQLDGYIVFNKRLEDVPPLPAPEGFETFELPGGTFPDAEGQLPPHNNNAGLVWNPGWDASDGLLPDTAVMYLVWRSYLGNGATPKPLGLQVLVTKSPPDDPKPLLVTEARLPNDTPSKRSPEWPKIPFFIDRNLPDGWYRHEVSGIDLFGRHSSTCPPAQLRLLDRIPPPMPTAVEAYALDPEDLYLQKDDAYKNWRASLASSGQQTLVGLRVRWIWTRAHQQQAPDTKEFRIYFHPGSDLPSAHDLAQNWQERFHVVAYNQHFSSINPTNREFLAIGGIDFVTITAAGGAKWWAVSGDPSWITISSGSSGNGSGALTYSVASNPGAPRTGTLKIAGHTFIINQQGVPSAPLVSPPAGAPEGRVYEVFLPLASATTPVGLALNPSFANPVVYAHIGVSAADDKPHTSDQRTSGNWSNRPGNEGRVGPTAKIYRVWRTKPGPPVALADTERVEASPADYQNRSFYTYRWQPPNQTDNLKLHLFRAMDDAIIKTDWFIRTTRIALDPGNPQHQRFFPKAWSQNVSRQQAAANALNAITSQADYNNLSNDAQELLASLPGNDDVSNLNELKQRDWAIRQSRQNLSAGDLNNFSWDQTKRNTVAGELNGIVLSGAAATAAGNKITLDGTPDLGRVLPARDPILLISDTKNANREYRITDLDVEARTVTLEDAPMLTSGASAWAIPLYQTLSDNGLRALAILPGNESAFVQVTINPLDSYESDPADSTKLRWRDRLGPDNADDFELHSDANALRAYIDTLDGRSTNRYLYRAAFVDGAHNHGELGLVGPVVYLPNVVPPRAPVITKVLGGDREITIKWASNREPDLAAYRLYRTDKEEATRDVRLMTLVDARTIEPTPDLAGRPAEITWTDAPVPGLVTFYYRLVAVGSNASVPSRVVAGRAFDDSRPDPPTWDPPSPGTTPNEVQLSWTSPVTDLTCLVQRRVKATGAWQNLSVWLTRGNYIFTDSERAAGVNYDYRLRVIDADGRSNRAFVVITL